MELDGGSQIESWRAQFERDGFLVLPGYFSAAEIDRLLAATEEALATRGMEIVVDNILTGERSFHAMAENPGSRLFKFNDLYLLLDEVRALALESRLSALLRALLQGERPVLCNSLTFVKGSRQPMHIDSLFMTPGTPRHLAASWTALEDVDPQAGPLVYFPGSHEIPLYKFSDGSHHAQVEELPQWAAYIEGELTRRGIAKETFLARKGDLFIWHSDLVHGGSVVEDASKTRRSLVCHYFTESDMRAAPATNLQPLNGGFWLDRFAPEVRTPPERFDAKYPFPEESYLRRHPDVRAAVAKGYLTSGFAHYRDYGFGEGRSI